MRPLPVLFLASQGRAVVPACVIPVLLFAVACRPGVQQMTAEVSDEWVRTYTPSAESTTVEIVNRNGLIQVDGVDTGNVEVRAERRVRASTDTTARDILAGLIIADEPLPRTFTVRTEGVEGVLIGASWEVHVRAKVPKALGVRLRTSNGNITVRDIAGPVFAEARNGEVLGEGLSGGVDGRTLNGRLRVVLSGLGEEPVNLRATNGRVDLVLPDDASALLHAMVTNGRLQLEGLKLDPIGEQSPRRMRGRLGDGRTPVDVNATNGAIYISNPASAAAR